MLHGRFSGLGHGIPNWIVVDIVRLEDGVLAEHWDVIQDEATRESSKSGLPMFGDRFAQLESSEKHLRLRSKVICGFTGKVEIARAHGRSHRTANK